MGQMKERNCVKHFHEKEDGGHNMVIRYESEKAECPLCVALEGAQPSDGKFEELEALLTQSEALAESFKNSNVQLEKDIAGYKVSLQTYEEEAKTFIEKIDLLQEEINALRKEKE